MNLYDINRLIRALVAEKLKSNRPLIEFYLKKRKELIIEIEKEISIKLKEV